DRRDPDIDIGPIAAGDCVQRAGSRSVASDAAGRDRAVVEPTAIVATTSSVGRPSSPSRAPERARHGGCHTERRNGHSLVELVSLHRGVEGPCGRASGSGPLAMCGIAGFIDLSTDTAAYAGDEDRVRAMCAPIRHRGPDDEGTF